jgi:hypothetical protein
MELGYGVLFADTLGAELVILYAEPVVFSIDRFTGASVYRSPRLVDIRFCIEREQSWSAQNLISLPWPCSSLLESVVCFTFLKIYFTFLKM